jgi:hypothetical protein
MSDQIKARILIVLLCLFSIGTNIGHWIYRIQTGGFYPMLSLFAPIAAVVFLMFSFFPSLAGQPRAKKDELIVTVVTFVGIALGAANWYLMANGF